MKSLEGPAWSAPGLDIAAGRYPLAVERHVMRMADLLVPGVTTVTPHGRYFALHALIAVEAEHRGLSNVETQRLLRRAEVALAAVSWSHEDGDTGLPRAHGTDALARRLHTGTVDVVEASQPGQNGYVRNSWGFWPPYSASEISLGVLAPGATPFRGPIVMRRPSVMALVTCWISPSERNSLSTTLVRTGRLRMRRRRRRGRALARRSAVRRLRSRSAVTAGDSTGNNSTGHSRDGNPSR